MIYSSNEKRPVKSALNRRENAIVSLGRIFNFFLGGSIQITDLGMSIPFFCKRTSGTVKSSSDSPNHRRLDEPQKGQND
jgi:hypothetical protein